MKAAEIPKWKISLPFHKLKVVKFQPFLKETGGGGYRVEPSHVGHKGVPPLPLHLSGARTTDRIEN